MDDDAYDADDPKHPTWAERYRTRYDDEDNVPATACISCAPHDGAHAAGCPFGEAR